MGEQEGHKHFWRVVGPAGRRWHGGHAMAACQHCDALTLVSRDEGVGPCAHVVARPEAEWPTKPEPLPIPMDMKLGEFQCRFCACIRDDSEEECPYCGNAEQVDHRKELA